MGWRSPHLPHSVKPRDPRPIPPYDNPPPSLAESDLSDKYPVVVEEAASWDPAKTEEWRTGQFEELQAADEALGTVFAELERLGEEEQTLAFFISDNGFLWGQHSLGKKNWPYLESVRVPFYARWPGRVPEGQIDSRLVANIDIAPTIFEAVGVEPDYEVDGRTLIGSGAREWLLLERPGPATGVSPKRWFSLISSNRQYIEWIEGFVEDYDLLADPWQLEASNVLVAELATRLDEARACAGSSCP